jgi:hypothetical protein
MSTDTVITIGTAFDRRIEVEVIKRDEKADGTVMYFVVLPSGLEAWVQARSLKREPKVEASVLASFVDPKTDPDRVTEPGMYKHGADLFKVQAAKGSGNLYAKRLASIGGARLTDEDQVVHFEFQYDQGAIYSLKASERMTLDEARAFGIQYGVCCVCGLSLKDAKSVAMGIGPVCIKRV